MNAQQIQHGPMTLEHTRAIAYHEAGHVVATTMRGSARFNSLDLRRHPDRDGITYMSHYPWDTPFLCFAGPWAEARLNWGDRPMDDEDDEGCVFRDHLTGMTLPGAPGRGDWEQSRLYDPLASCPDGMDREQWEDFYQQRQDTWCYELERQWPLIQAVADHIMQCWTLTPSDLDRLVQQHAN